MLSPGAVRTRCNRAGPGPGSVASIHDKTITKIIGSPHLQRIRNFVDTTRSTWGNDQTLDRSVQKCKYVCMTTKSKSLTLWYNGILSFGGIPNENRSHSTTATAPYSTATFRDVSFDCSRRDRCEDRYSRQHQSGNVDYRDGKHYARNDLPLTPYK